MFEFFERIFKKILILHLVLLILSQLCFYFVPTIEPYFNKAVQYEGVAKPTIKDDLVATFRVVSNEFYNK